MQASVIIPTRNRPVQLIALLNSLASQANATALRWETIVVDDASRREAREAVERHLAAAPVPAVRYLYREEWRGVCRARNAGVSLSRGEVLAFLDDDIVVDRQFLAQTLRVHAVHPEVLVLNGLLEKMDDGFYSQFWHYYYSAVFNKPSSGPYEVRRLASGHFSVKRELLSKTGPLFDESLTARCDLDLYLRLRDARIPVYKDDSIIAYHGARQSLRSLIQQRLWYERGEEMLRRKYGARRLSEFYRNEPRIARNWRFLPVNLTILGALQLYRLSRWLRVAQ